MDFSVLLSLEKLNVNAGRQGSKEEERTQCTAITIKYTTNLNVFSYSLV